MVIIHPPFEKNNTIYKNTLTILKNKYIIFTECFIREMFWL